MSYYDSFQRRINSDGDNPRERMINIQKSYLKDKFQHSPSYYEVSINNVSKGVIIINTNFSYTKELLMPPDDTLVIGDVLTWKDKKWLCVNVYDSEVSIKGDIQYCNNSLTVVISETENIVGYDAMNRPIIRKIPVTKEIPCVAISKDNLTMFTDFTQDKVINMPDGRLLLTTPSFPENYIKYGDEFIFFNNKYKIIGINKTIEGIFNLLLQIV